MKKTLSKLGRLFIRGRIFTPQGFIFRAVLIVIFFLLMEVLGLRRYAMILSGTSPTANAQDMVAIVIACLYIVFYMAFIFLAPILFMASGFFYLFTRKTEKSHK
ncbi:MAG: hypothetical protein JW860_06415 [Sedimentisphaerales bacterium]|nr:hypothetical protein [Sedimentisphaerales bacterium]